MLAREHPHIYVIDGFLSGVECSNLIACADPHLQASGTAFGGQKSAEQVRTSSTVMLRPNRPEAAKLHAQTARLLRKPTQHMEDPQVSRYRPGEYYLPHFDGPDPVQDPTWSEFHACGGQRTATVLVYLNDVERGGATRFPSLGMEVRPKLGRALVFFPGREDGSIDAALIHEACPAIDTKWVAQVWVRHGVDPYRRFMDTPSSV